MIEVLLVLALLQTVPANDYRAVGEDAAWTLAIAAGQLTLETPGQATISERAPAPSNEQGILHYQTSRLQLTVMPGVTCRTREGARYTDAVYVSVGGEERSGCGGALLAPDALAGTSWLFVEIDGERTEVTGDLLRDDRFMIDFHVGGFVGYGGCNRFSAGYSQSGDLVTAHAPWGRSTRNCGPVVTERETRLLRILAEPVRISRPDPSTIVLTGARGTIRLRHISNADQP